MDDPTELRIITASRWLYSHKRTLIGASLTGAVTLFAASFLITPSYEATAIVRPIEVAPTDEQNGIAGSAVTGLAGALLGTTQADQSAVTLAYFTSTSFISAFIIRENLLPELFPSKWNPQQNAWTGEKPMLEDATRRMKKRFTVTDRSDGLWTLTVDWSTPERAISVAQALIKQVNQDRRAVALTRAKSNLDYMYKRLAHEPIQEMRENTARLATVQLEKIMTAQGPNDFALEIVDAPNASRFRASPNRKLLTAAGGMGGLFLAIFFLLSRRAIENLKAASPPDT
jgi:LPS O-antigen subunit length determinant protein (WzzB/FepE family)